MFWGCVSTEAERGDGPGYFETPFAQESHQVTHWAVVVDHQNLSRSKELKHWRESEWVAK